MGGVGGGGGGGKLTVGREKSVLVFLIFNEEIQEFLISQVSK